ncbi:olfactory receptor 52E8-like [Ictalurus punctatus]|uniref:Olfactory receptor 52E8-like n=1 Tax=Ictalurus punctatus TaxID=7998 RepID=A0A9F7TFQ3_ICTPU|nr:olfactory receptor 52E8-like [Ictalurus punctatus]
MTICCNTIVIFVIYTNESLHEPMYIFITALLMNTLGGSTALYPKLLSDILSKNLIVSLDACVFQAFFIYTYAMSEFMLLSAMAYDRYVSICKPLQYAAIVKMSTVKKLIFLSCFVPSLIFIIYSYIRILSVCLNNSKDFRRKALQTCLPHLLIFTSFTVTSCFEIINSRLEGNMPHIIAMILSVENLVIPPLFNPIIYGLKLQEIFNRIKRMFWKKKIHIFLD